VIAAPTAWVDVNPAGLHWQTAEWWTQFADRNSARPYAGRIRVPCDNQASAEHVENLLSGYGIPRGAMRIGRPR
jgi:hypothetical protein